MWLKLSEKFGANLHHRDVVSVALRRMNHELERNQDGVVADIVEELEKRRPQVTTERG
jgi:hypothetical protein